MSNRFRIPALVAGVGLVVAAAAIGTVAAFKHQTPLQVLMQPVVPSPQQVFGKPHLLVLVVGLDYDYDNLDIETSRTSRSDIIKVVNLDFDAKKAYILSVPRDMDVILPNGQEAKINQAQSDGGIKETQAVVAKWLGIPAFDRYVVLRIDTMKDLINALGGVDVAVENSDALRNQGPNGPIDYDDTWGHLHVHLKPGMQHLDGPQAVGYARFRHDWCSDPCRIMRQDQVIRALVTRLRSNKLNTLAHIDDLLGVVHRDVETSLTTQEMFSIANAFSDLSPGAIAMAQIPYVADKDVPYYGNVIIPDERARAYLVRSMLVAPPPVVGTLRVDVKNGTTTTGLARRVAGLLKAKGFTIGTIGDAPTPNVLTTELHSATPASAHQVLDALGSVATNATIVTDGTAGVTIVIGRDLADALGTASAE
ncbi:MAG: LCP family protein [Candidatus Eremiobacteraeota bacterium]|nr:LCP family protein [Candidatus Eremiobacteraeota bacterium]